MVQTRSAVKKTERAQPANANDGGSTLVDLVKAKDPPPAKKPRQEKEVANKKRYRGKRVELCQLNLDVLFLIAAYIHPLDLLNLARTCKSLRELLMGSSSAFVWKTARRQVKKLPPCPDDLTEPEYANLVFYDRCHGCDKYTTTIMWNVRRRYCPGCRIRRLRPLSSCNEVIRVSKVLPTELIQVKKVSSVRVDRDQAATFTQEFRQSRDKMQFIMDAQKKRKTILQHAQQCKAWQEQRDKDRKRDKKESQQVRRERIFNRLREHGYSREISYFGYSRLEHYRERDFRSSKPLTDKEWERMLPEWVELMKELQLQRLDATVYDARRCEFSLAYDRYVSRPSSDAPTIELLPHAVDVARFLPFRGVIRAPEETLVNNKSFTSAFEQLPTLVAEWREKLDAELAQLVDIPEQLRPAKLPDCQSRASCRSRQSLSADTDKLQLACAVFRTGLLGVFNHHDVFSVSMSNHSYKYDRGEDKERSGSIKERFGIQFMEEAPFIVHACGLDPSKATVSDMDSQNARLKCLSCEGANLVMNWRHAMLHACRHDISSSKEPRSKSPRWQLISYEHIDAIQAAEQSLGEDSFPSFVRCMLCKPHVGDGLQSLREGSNHMSKYHNLKIEHAALTQGVHYTPVGLFPYPRLAVEAVEEGREVTFRAPSKQGRVRLQGER